ncbi:hypothetical protein ACLOJK_001836 [Asimina triloba]
MRPSAQTMLSTAASVAASLMLVRTIANDLLPGHIQDLLFSSLRSIFHRFSSDLTIIIDEFNGFSTNKLYDAAQMYLGSKISPSTTRRLRVSKDDGDKDFTVSMERGETVVDVFQGLKLEWQFIRHENQKNERHSYDGQGSTIVCQSHSFYLTFHKKHKDRVLQSYLPHVLAQAKAMMDEKKTLKLHTIDCETMRVYGTRSSPWKSVNLSHPATFSTVAMDAEAKEALIEDLERFVERKEFYRRVGKAWKRGYLLYGPPGTGKSSLIAAMANFLNFDVYDLELTDVTQNSDLRRILIATANRSILVIEDIDCTVDFKDRNEAAQEALEPMGRGRHQEEKKVSACA